MRIHDFTCCCRAIERTDESAFPRSDWPNSDIYVSTAPKLEGPWSSPVTLGTTCPTGTCGNLRYCIAPHPEFDDSGKTLLVTWTDANVIHAVKIEWQ